MESVKERRHAVLEEALGKYRKRIDLQNQQNSYNIIKTNHQIIQHFD
jgi:hypothetical protein